VAKILILGRFFEKILGFLDRGEGREVTF